MMITISVFAAIAALIAVVEHVNRQTLEDELSRCRAERSYTPRREVEVAIGNCEDLVRTGKSLQNLAKSSNTSIDGGLQRIARSVAELQIEQKRYTYMLTQIDGMPNDELFELEDQARTFNGYFDVFNTGVKAARVITECSQLLRPEQRFVLRHLIDRSRGLKTAGQSQNGASAIKVAYQPDLPPMSGF